MQSRLPDIRRLDAELLAISVDPPQRNRRAAAAWGVDFPLLSDPAAQVIREYGVLHQAGGPGGDIARPAVFVLDRQGRIAWRELTDNWRVRVRPERILDELGRLP